VVELKVAEIGEEKEDRTSADVCEVCADSAAASICFVECKTGNVASVFRAELASNDVSKRVCSSASICIAVWSTVLTSKSQSKITKM